MAKTVSFLTTEREDLFTVSRRLIDAIDPAFLSDPAKPILISVRGAYGGGKKIFPDAVKDHLLHRGVEREGLPEYDEYWCGEDGQGSKREVDFINLGWRTGYAKVNNDAKINNDFNSDEKEKNIVKNFLALRKYGGVSFLHNYKYSENSEIAIDICLEQANNFPVTYDQPDYEKEPASLQQKFSDISRDKQWARYVKITVHSPELLASEKFNAALEQLAPPTADRKEIPIYGLNAPTPP